MNTLADDNQTGYHFESTHHSDLEGQGKLFDKQFKGEAIAEEENEEMPEYLLGESHVLKAEQIVGLKKGIVDDGKYSTLGDALLHVSSTWLELCCLPNCDSNVVVNDALTIPHCKVIYAELASAD